jgi:hypothetical protein
MLLNGQRTAIKPGDRLAVDLRHGRVWANRANQVMRFQSDEYFSLTRGSAYITEFEAKILISFMAELANIEYRVVLEDDDNLIVEFI